MKMRWMIALGILAFGLAACAPVAETPAPVEERTELVVPTAEAAEPARPETAEAGVENLPSTGAEGSVEVVQCTSPAALTPPAMAGPFYTSGSPERTSLVEDLPGTRLTLTGYVLDADCQPVPGAWVDFWQADSQGVYDNSGYTLRGHQYTDENGRYTLETIVPGEYPGRTEHLHVKVRAPGGPELTTQLYFPDASQNQRDRIFDERLLIEVTGERADGITARFDFVVEER